MSRASGKGDELGRYYTEIDVARAIVDWLPFMRPGLRVLEPSAGGGAFLEALVERDAREDLGLFVHALDVDAGAPCFVGGTRLPYVARCADFLDPQAVAGWERPDVVLGNPPFSINRREVAREHVERSLQVTRQHVVLVLRLGFLAWTGRDREDLAGRAGWWPLRRPTSVLLLTPRCSFNGGRTDGSEYAAYWWDVQRPPPIAGAIPFDWLPWGKYR